MTDNTTKPTPGPWSLLHKDGSAAHIDIVAGHIIATVGRHAGLLDAFNAMQAANARLIAAAPELLEELIKAANALDHLAFNIGREDGDGMTREGAASFAAAAWENTRAAIARAAGATP